MKKIFMILVALIVLAVAGYIILGNKSVQSPTLPQATTSSTVVVTNLAPAVFIKATSDSQKQEVATTSAAIMGSTVSTGEVGRALIEEPSKKIVLDFDTELVLSSNVNGGESNTLTAGSIWSRVEKVLEKGEFYEIETKNAVAAVRGTSFGVTYKDETTFLVVTEGAVCFTPIDPTSGQVDETKAVIVKAGEKAQIKDGKISVSAISSSDKKDPWYVFVNGLLSPMTSQTTLQATSTVSTTNILNTTTPPPKPNTTSSPNGGSPSSPSSPSSSDGGTVVTQEPVQSSNISIRGISPGTMQQGATDNPITLTGVGFKDVTTILLNKTAIQYFTVYSDTQIDFGINPETQPGTYDVTVITSTNTQDTLLEGLTVTPIESRSLQNNAQ